MPPDLEPPRGADQWMALSDALLAGLVHTMNNRVTALSVCAELAQLGDQQMIADGMLSAEVRRLQRATELMALLPARPREPEALELRPLLEDAIDLHAHHPLLRSIECKVEVDGAMQPVRAPRWALLRLLLLLVDAAKAAVGESERATCVRLGSDAAAARVCVKAAGDGGSYGAEMSALCGGTLAREGDDLVLTLPSLKRLRERERSASAAD